MKRESLLRGNLPRLSHALSVIYFILGIAAVFAPLALAGNPQFEIVIKDHLFEPAKLIVPANNKVKLILKNLDATPEEFESYELNREKVIVGNSTATIYIGPLKPGVYPYFGEFHPKTAQGLIVVE